MKLEFLEFLLPQLDWMQGFFFLLIFGTTLGIVWQVKRSAKPQNWEKNWHNGKEGDKSGDLDAEHGSIHDISQAVATKPEQWADVMPGILLVIGLLGTFLGLGIALNKASAILIDASASGMDDAMSNLMEMMQGLGTKFKTSTWGIIAFLGLKFWASHNGFDEHRLRWTAQKMKRELDDSRSQLLGREYAAQREFVNSISALGDKLCATLLKEFTEHRDTLVKEGADTGKRMSMAIQTVKIELINNRKLLQQELVEQRSILQDNQEILEQKRLIAREAADQGKKLQQTLESFATANFTNIQSVQSSIKNLEVKICGTLQHEFLGHQKTLVKEAADTRNTFQSELSSMASQVGAQGAAIRQTLESFAKENANNIESVQSDIEGLKEKVCETLQQQFSGQKEVLEKEGKGARNTFQSEFATSLNFLEKKFASQQSILQSSQKILEEHKKIAREAVDKGTAIRQTLESFAAANSSKVDSVRTGIDGLREKLSSTIQKELSDQRSLLQSSKKVLDEHKNIAHQALAQGTSMRQALESFISANSSNIESMHESSQKMAISADKAGDSATKLGISIHSFETNVSEVMNVLKQDLKLTIDDMNSSFKSNMSDISINLVGATKDISKAVDTLSVNVEQTMVEVEKSIGKSLETQQRTQAVFGETSATLNTNVESLTQLINQLCDDIKSGLRAVSESGRRMTSLDSRYQNVSESTENIAEKLEELSGQISEAVSRLQSPAVHINFDPLLTALESIKRVIENQEIKLSEQMTAMRIALSETQFQQVNELSSQISAAVSRLQSPAVHIDLDPLLKSLGQIQRSVDIQESKLVEQIADLRTDVPTDQLDQVVVLLRDISKTLDKPDRAAVQELEV